MAEYCPPTASNFVCTARIRVDLNIYLLALLLHGRASKEAFPCCTITGRNPRLTYQIFKGGKIVISGAASEAQGHWGLVRFVSRLSDLTGQHIKLYEFRTENIVAFGGLPFYFDQLQFFRENQMALAPPKRYMELAPDPSSSATKQQQQQQQQEIKSARGKKRKRMKGKTYTQFKSGRFRGLQYFARYPSVMIFYDTGKYVVTGTDDPREILRVVNCQDWSRYKLKMPLDKFRALLAVNHRGKRKQTAMGGHKELENTKLFSSILWQGFEFHEKQKAAKSRHHHA